MTTRAAILLAVAAIAIVGFDTCQIAPAPCCDDGLTSQFIVNTTDRFQGDAGVKTLNDACAGIDETMYMCTSDDILRTTAGNPISDWAWVRPSGFVAAGANSIAVWETGSGLSENQAYLFTCQGWNSTNGAIKGLAVGPGGSFDTWGCSTSLPVACCGRR